MRALQVLLFVLGLVAFIAAAFLVGSVMGDALWRTGVALLLLDIVCIKLWPAAASKKVTEGF